MNKKVKEVSTKFWKKNLLKTVFKKVDGGAIIQQ